MIRRLAMAFLDSVKNGLTNAVDTVSGVTQAIIEKNRLNAQLNRLRAIMKSECEKAIEEQKQKKNSVLNGFAAKNDIIHQLIDLALLQNGMLKGEALDKFLKRSVDLIK